MLGKRLEELAIRADRLDIVVFSRFLDPAEAALAQAAARQARVEAVFEGGISQAERRMAAFVPDAQTALDWPLACMALSWDTRYGSVRHPDLLGASLALIQDRSCFGDIVMVDPGQAYLFVLRELAQYVVENLTSAGRTPLKARILDHWPEPESAEQRFTRDTVASFRLDAMLASAFDLSRGQAQEAIGQGLVKLNHVQTLATDAQLRPGDLISLRGRGRARFDRTDGVNRKGRTAIWWSRNL